MMHEVPILAGNELGTGEMAIVYAPVTTYPIHGHACFEILVYEPFVGEITVNGKKIVYSGDIRHLEEMSPFLRDCDLLLMENGHHKPWQVAEKIRKNPAWKIKRLIFLHHGRSVLNTPEETARKTEKAWGKPAEFAVDGMTLML